MINDNYLLLISFDRRKILQISNLFDITGVKFDWNQMWNKLYTMLCWPLTRFNLTLWPEELEIDQWKYHCKICQRVQLHRVMKKPENIEWIYKSLHRGKVKVESSRTLMDHIVYSISDWCTYRNNDRNLRIQWWSYEW